MKKSNLPILESWQGARSASKPIRTGRWRRSWSSRSSGRTGRCPRTRRTWGRWRGRWRRRKSFRRDAKTSGGRTAGTASSCRRDPTRTRRRPSTLRRRSGRWRGWRRSRCCWTRGLCGNKAEIEIGMIIFGLHLKTFTVCFVAYELDKFV